MGLARAYTADADPLTVLPAGGNALRAPVPLAHAHLPCGQSQPAPEVLRIARLPVPPPTSRFVRKLDRISDTRKSHPPTQRYFGDPVEPAI